VRHKAGKSDQHVALPKRRGLVAALFVGACLALLLSVLVFRETSRSLGETASNPAPAVTPLEHPAWTVWTLPQNREAAQMAAPDRAYVLRPVMPPSAAPEAAPAAPVAPPATELPQSAPLAPATPTWRRNAVRALPADGRPMIAILIDDVGVARHNTELVMALDPSVTLSFMTYAGDAPAQVAAARTRGHEIMLHLPMEPLDHGDNPGPNALVVGLPAAELERRIGWGLGRFEGFVGVNNHMGSRFTANREGMAALMAALKQRGLLFVDSRTTASSVGAEMARLHGVPAASRDVFLDNEVDAGDIEARLAETERRARAQGAAIAIGHPHPETIATLRRWIPQAQARGFVLVPVSAVVARGLTD
jgi:polysaccharide deacetylase 2 family uncharacterized protein YibQ